MNQRKDGDEDIPLIQRGKKFYNKNKILIWEACMLALLFIFLSLLIFTPVRNTESPEAPKIDLGKYLLLQSQEKKFPLGDMEKAPEPAVEIVYSQPTTVNQPVYTGGCEQWRGLVAKYFPADQVDNCLAVMNGESGGNPSAASPTNDHGLLQINAGTWPGYADGLPLTMAYEPETNIRIASYIYGSRGWSPWSVARNLGI